MKRIGNLYPKIYDFENLHRAYLLARRNKRFRGAIIEFSNRLEENLIEIQNELIWKTYQTGHYHEFYVYEPKKRLIKSLAFKDRVVQHAINNIIEPIFESTFIFDSYACRKGKGIHSGVDRLTYFLRKIHYKNKKVYALKCDIQKYFPSISHNVLYSLVLKKIKYPETLKLLWKIINSDGEIGIPIGNLTSQLFANIYLNQLDHFVKEDLGIKYYIRYMDDFIILHQDKDYLRNILKEVETYLNNKLRLTINTNTTIFPVSQGIDFLGYRSWKTHRLLRKSNVVKFRRALREFQNLFLTKTISFDKINASIQSWLGHAKHADTYNLRKRIFNEFKLQTGE